MKTSYTLFISLLFVLATSCTQKEEQTSKEVLEQSFITSMRLHLDAVEQKDTIVMAKTLPTDGPVYFLQPQRELSSTPTSFMDFHAIWFKNATHPWSIEFKILETEVGNELGIAVVECLYQEPERNGKSYFNRLHVTYVQKRMDNKWYIILDHATSIEKSAG